MFAPSQKDFCPKFSFGSIIFLVFTFKPKIHFELIFIYVIKWGLIFIFFSNGYLLFQH